MSPLLSALTAHLVPHLRRAFRYSPVRKALKALKAKECAECGKVGKVEFDHDPPVVPLDSSAREMHPVEYLCRLFLIDEITGDVDFERVRPLCGECHDACTKEQVKVRAANKRKRGHKNHKKGRPRRRKRCSK